MNDLLYIFLKEIHINNIVFKVCFFNPHLKTCLLILKGREGRERNINVIEKHQLVAFRMHPTGDKTNNLGMCPDWELNLQSFGLWDDAPTN